MFSYVKNEQLEYVLSFKFCSFTRKDASEVNSYFNEDFVTQHDILRELAMHQSSQEPIEKRSRLIVNISQNNLPKWWNEQKQQLIDHARLLSISTGWHIFSLSKIHAHTRYVTYIILIACLTVYNSFCRSFAPVQLVQHSSTQC